MATLISQEAIFQLTIYYNSNSQCMAVHINIHLTLEIYYTTIGLRIKSRRITHIPYKKERASQLLKIVNIAV